MKVLLTENDLKYLSHRNVQPKTLRFDATIDCNIIATTHTGTHRLANLRTRARAHTHTFQSRWTQDRPKSTLKYNTFIDSLSLQMVTVTRKGDYSPACDNGFITQSINTKYQGLGFIQTLFQNRLYRYGKRTFVHRRMNTKFNDTELYKMHASAHARMHTYTHTFGHTHTHTFGQTCTSFTGRYNAITFNCTPSESHEAKCSPKIMSGYYMKTAFPVFVFITTINKTTSTHTYFHAF